MSVIDAHDGCLLAEHGQAPSAVADARPFAWRRRLARPVPARAFQIILDGGRSCGLLRPAHLPEGSRLRSVVVVRTDEIGDLVLTLPYLRALRTAWPSARVTLIARPGPNRLVEGTALVDETIDWVPLPGRQDTVAGQARSLRFARSVLRRSGRFDLAVLPRRDFESRGARHIAAAVAVRTVGFDTLDRPMTRWDRDERRLLAHAVCSGDPTAHELTHLRRLAEATGFTVDAGTRPGLTLLTEGDRARARALLAGPAPDRGGEENGARRESGVRPEGGARPENGARPEGEVAGAGIGRAGTRDAVREGSRAVVGGIAARATGRGGAGGAGRPGTQPEARVTLPAHSAESVHQQPVLISVALGAGAPKRCWAPGKYAAVVAAAHAREPVRVVVVGGAEDRERAEGFRRALPEGLDCLDVTGRTSLRETLALVAESAAYLGGDTGVMHLASSVGVPCLVVSCHPRGGDPRSANAVNRFGPWSAGSRHVGPDRPAPGCSDQCRANAPHCIETVTEHQVIRPLLDLLASRPVGTA